MSEQQLLAIMTVEVNPQLSDQIYIHEFDDPRDLTIMFANKHDLPGRLLLKLVDSISQHKQQALQHYELQKQGSPTKSSNYFGKTQTPLKNNSVQNSTIFSKLNSNRSRMTSSHAALSPFQRQSISPEQGSRLFYLGEEIKAKREQRLQKIRDENKNINCTFTPQINQMSQQLAKKRNESQGKIKIEERLINCGKKQEINMQQLRMRKIMDDLETEQRFPYQPKVRQSDALLDKSLKSNSKTYRDLHNNRKFSMSSLHLPSQEQTIAQQVWLACLKRIFKQIDTSSSGQLSSQSVDLSKLDYQLLQIIGPILVEMEENGWIMEFEQFAHSVTQYCLKHNFIEYLLGAMLNQGL